ncbi:MAG: Gfo/Idh/MocA family oxidoreductase [Planctomycetota bacterium]
MIEIGIIGTGSIADTSHGPALGKLRGARLWSVLSRDRERAFAFAARHGAAAEQPAFGDLESFLADPRLDAVIIASPDRRHAEHIVAAARAGKHVLVEKPMVISEEEGHAAVAACADADVRLGVAFHLRWHAGHRMARERIAAGALGELRHLRLHWTFAGDPANWRARPELGRWWSLAANGPHLLDLCRWFAPEGGAIEEARAVLSHAVYGGPHDETAVVALRHASGLTAEIVTSVLFDSEPRVEIYGTKGAMQAVGTLGRHGSGRIFLGGEPLVFEPVSPFVGEIQDFVDAIAEGRAPEVDGESGLDIVRTMIRLVP